MTERLTINRQFHVTKKRRSKQIQNGSKPIVPAGRVPRISRLLALAHHCFRLVKTGAIINQSELAHFGQISTTRMTQIMWLDNTHPTSKKRSYSCPEPPKAATQSKKPIYAPSPRHSTGISSDKCGGN
ncbi:MAG: hypothetical protein NTW52_20295 [Planctomycetota bacterium]|nr:hypothetical protein [Planctomycetota bacterium]